VSTCIITWHRAPTHSLPWNSCSRCVEGGWSRDAALSNTLGQCLPLNCAQASDAHPNILAKDSLAQVIHAFHELRGVAVDGTTYADICVRIPGTPECRTVGYRWRCACKLLCCRAFNSAQHPRVCFVLSNQACSTGTTLKQPCEQTRTFPGPFAKRLSLTALHPTRRLSAGGQRIGKLRRRCTCAC